MSNCTRFVKLTQWDGENNSWVHIRVDDISAVYSLKPISAARSTRVRAGQVVFEVTETVAEVLAVIAEAEGGSSAMPVTPALIAAASILRVHEYEKKTLIMEHGDPDGEDRAYMTKYGIVAAWLERMAG